jgi:hypothetical protein
MCTFGMLNVHKLNCMKFTWTWRLTLLTPLTILISILTAGAGHGTPFPILFLYPITFAFSVVKNDETLLWIVLLGQFPFYGFVIDLAKQKYFRIIAVCLIIVLHGALIMKVWNSEKFWEGLA